METCGSEPGSKDKRSAAGARKQMRTVSIALAMITVEAVWRLFDYID